MKLPKEPNLKKICDNLWADVVKAKAGYKSEYSGKLGKQIGGEEILNAHHLCGKGSRFLRYCLDNGMSLTMGEHKYIAHHTGRQEMFRDRVKQLRGGDIYDRLKLMKNNKSPSLILIKIYLEQELEKYK